MRLRRRFGWRHASRWFARRDPPTVAVDTVRRRLELLLRAMYDRSVPIVEAEAPAPPGWRSWLRRWTARRRDAPVLPWTDGQSVFLPNELVSVDGAAAGLAHYRVLALEQAERITRGTMASAPPDGDLLERDLFLISEAAAADAAICRAMPGAVPALAEARALAMTTRPQLERLSAVERVVETLVRGVLRGDPTQPSVGVPDNDTAADSLNWSRAMAKQIREAHGPRHRYRGVPPASLWGTLRPPPGNPLRRSRPMVAEQSAPASAPEWASPRKTSAATRAAGSSSDAKADPRGSGSSPEPNDAADIPPTPTKGPGEAPVESARFSERAPPTPANQGSPPAPSTMANVDDPTPAAIGVRYPEWDADANQYRRDAVLVRSLRPAEGDPAWVFAVRRDHAALVRRVRQRFEMLRARRTRTRQQRDGDELDLSACVRALVDQRAGRNADDRLYIAVRPARRSIAIAMLVDVSGSTDTRVTPSHQVIDVEKIALMLAADALDALGDPYVMLTFCSRGANDVRVTTIKDFGEPSGELVRRRIAALAPEGNTRLGAAVRHATALLARQHAGHRLLLILSDGRPNDLDGYHEAYGVEDARQAILEARAMDIYPFCLTIDREGAEYLPRIFGAAGHTILRQPDQLPLALLQLVRHLLRT